MLSFRTLRADEIDCRVATVKGGQQSGNGVSLLLYKDARCDMNILDETVGAFNWQRTHSRENANCTVSIWDEDKKQWVSKEDTGTESNTEKEKGLASDSFKRACFNWGIGRELYTAPFIWIPEGKVKLEQWSGRWSTKDRFHVVGMLVENGRITALEIANKKGEVVYTFGETEGKKNDDAVTAAVGAQKISAAKAKALKAAFVKAKQDEGEVLAYFQLGSIEEMSEAQYAECVRIMNAKKGA